MPSTVIRDFAYDAASGTLTVTFVTGRRYAYAAVAEAVVREFAAAFSKGRFFNARIRDRFPARELAREADPAG